MVQLDSDIYKMRSIILEVVRVLTPQEMTKFIYFMLSYESMLVDVDGYTEFGRVHDQMIELADGVYARLGSEESRDFIADIKEICDYGS